MYFTSSKVTADFIVDTLESFWKKNQHRFKKIHTLVINSDNGPECNSRRTWFIHRICQFAYKYNIKVQLAYYPPYHSKYNPIERVWGGLEQHWNTDILDSKKAVLEFAKSFTWAKKKAIVHFCDKIYETGKKLSAKAMEKYELYIDRINDSIGKWFITINPEKVKELFVTD